MLKNYLKIALKVLMRRKFFTFISLFGIALTLVVLTVAAAILDHVFGPQPPEVFSDRALTVYHMEMTTPEGYRRTGSPGYAFLDRHVRTLPDVELVSIHSWPSTALSYVGGERIRSSVKQTDGAFWEVTGFDFLEGGPYTEEDVREARPVAVISASLRRRYFGDEAALGQRIELDHRHYRVVGTVRDVSLLRIASFADAWTPVTTAKTDAYLDEHIMGRFMGTILAHDPSDFPAIKASFRTRLQQVDLPRGYSQLRASPDTQLENVYHIVTRDYSSGGAAVVLGVLTGLAVLFMMLPAVNLVNINMSRILERSSEIGARRAFGASSRTLVVQFLVENVVLCLVGGMIGFVLAFGVLHIVSGSGLVPYAVFHVNARVFSYGLLLALVFAALSGAYPAWRMARLHPVDALRRSAL